MARYKDYSYDEQTVLIPVSYQNQNLPGTFDSKATDGRRGSRCNRDPRAEPGAGHEHTLSEVIDSIDLPLFENRYRNDATVEKAHDPKILLKNVLYAYLKGIIYSRRIVKKVYEKKGYPCFSGQFAR